MCAAQHWYASIHTIRTHSHIRDLESEYRKYIALLNVYLWVFSSFSFICFVFRTTAACSFICVSYVFVMPCRILSFKYIIYIIIIITLHTNIYTYFSCFRFRRIFLVLETNNPTVLLSKIKKNVLRKLTDVINWQLIHD